LVSTNTLRSLSSLHITWSSSQTTRRRHRFELWLRFFGV